MLSFFFFNSIIPFEYAQGRRDSIFCGSIFKKIEQRFKANSFLPLFFFLSSLHYSLRLRSGQAIFDIQRFDIQNAPCSLRQAPCAKRQAPRATRPTLPVSSALSPRGCLRAPTSEVSDSSPTPKDSKAPADYYEG